MRGFRTTAMKVGSAVQSGLLLLVDEVGSVSMVVYCYARQHASGRPRASCNVRFVSAAINRCA